MILTNNQVHTTSNVSATNTRNTSNGAKRSYGNSSEAVSATKDTSKVSIEKHGTVIAIHHEYSYRIW